MTYSDTGKRDTLYFRLISGSTESPGSWGHEYVRHLAAELGEEYNSRFAEAEEEPQSAPNGTSVKTGSEEVSANGNGVSNGDVDIEMDKGASSGPVKVVEEKREYQLDELRKLSMELVEFFLKHNAEADAVDLLLEVEDIRSIVNRVDDKTWPRVCQYMVG